VKPVEDLLDGVIRVPLPRRSLLVMSGEPRYQWEHAILRKDIQTRRIVIAYRELVLFLDFVFNLKISGNIIQ
jgi:alkylated DNA repair protein alkB family protein 4